jgi:acyl carrier protein
MVDVPRKVRDAYRFWHAHGAHPGSAGGAVRPSVLNCRPGEHGLPGLCAVLHPKPGSEHLQGRSRVWVRVARAHNLVPFNAAAHLIPSHMNVQEEVVAIIGEVLGLGGRASALGRESPLLGAIPELDSMAVVALLTSFEDRLGITVADDEVHADTFATVGSLVDFVAARLG